MTQRTEMRRDVLRLGSLAALSPAVRLHFSHAGLTTSSTFLVRGEDFRTENWLLARLMQRFDEFAPGWGGFG